MVTKGFILAGNPTIPHICPVEKPTNTVALKLALPDTVEDFLADFSAFRPRLGDGHGVTDVMEGDGGSQHS